MEYLKSFIMTLATVVIFLTAVKMILPNNSFEKYQNFVLSLIILSIMITPIINIFSSDFSMEKKIEDFIDNELSVSSESVYEGKGQNSFVIDKLEKNCKVILEEKFTGNKFSIDIDGKVNLDNFDVDLKELVVNVKKIDTSDDVKRVEKVEIGENELTENDKEIIDFLVSQLNIDSKIIDIRRE